MGDTGLIAIVSWLPTNERRAYWVDEGVYSEYQIYLIFKSRKYVHVRNMNKKTRCSINEHDSCDGEVQENFFGVFVGAN